MNLDVPFLRTSFISSIKFVKLIFSTLTLLEFDKFYYASNIARSISSFTITSNIKLRSFSCSFTTLN